MPSDDVLASSCPPESHCPKVVRRRTGVLTVVGAAVTDSADLAVLGMDGGEGAVHIEHSELLTG